MSTAPSTGAGVPTTENCRFCWMCRHVCPVGAVTHRETHTPHAWALTIESVRRGQLQWNAETADVLYACADCGLCQAHCATDQPLPDAIARAREAVVAVGQAPAAILELRDRLSADGHPYGADPSRASDVVSTGRHAMAAASPAPERTAALFVGDAAHHLAPAAVEAATFLLQAAGVRTIPVGVGRSSGWLASSAGLSEVASTLARRALAEIAETAASEVIVLSTADRWALEHVYPVRLGLPLPAGLVVKEAVGVLADGEAGGTLRFGTQPGPAYGYHDPCHSVRVARDGAVPRRLLVAALGEAGARQLFWREGRAHPCGALGGLEWSHPDIARALAESRLADAKAAGVSRLITEDASCAHHLRQASRSDVLVENLFEVLAPLCVR